MNCTEINNWINNASDTEIEFPPKAISEHLLICKNCEARVLAIQQSFHFINDQKNESLSEEKTVQIIEHLIATKDTYSPKLVSARFVFNKVAVILIIAFGLLTGIIAGRLLFNDNGIDEDPWSTEFPLLSDNTEYVLFD